MAAAAEEVAPKTPTRKASIAQGVGAGQETPDGVQKKRKPAVTGTAATETKLPNCFKRQQECTLKLLTKHSPAGWTQKILKLKNSDYAIFRPKGDF